ncbi:MAG: hypothetical protein PHU04_03190 [Candidatus Peribacteraceae bacterium]|nr:hypothetical protein [Candidatus Peribacteraceae bacterium]
MDKKPQTPADTELLRDLERLLTQSQEGGAQLKGNIEIDAVRVLTVNRLMESLQQLRTQLTAIRSPREKRIELLRMGIAGLKEIRQQMYAAKEVITPVSATHQVKKFFGGIRHGTHVHQLRYYQWEDEREQFQRTRPSVTPCEYFDTPLPGHGFAVSDGAEKNARQYTVGCLLDVKIISAAIRKNIGQNVDIRKMPGCLGDPLQEMMERTLAVQECAIDTHKELSSLLHPSAVTDQERLIEGEIAQKQQLLNQLLGLPQDIRK